MSLVSLGGAEDPAADRLLRSPFPGSSPLPVPEQSSVAGKATKRRGASDAEWAVRGGIPDVRAAFDRLRPSLAMNFPFELDTFQKEAVIHLEQV